LFNSVIRIRMKVPKSESARFPSPLFLHYINQILFHILVWLLGYDL
jgi:hypothetical protein